jgi:hypothetical protein
MSINGKLFNYENGLNGNMNIYVAVQEQKKLMQLNYPPNLHPHHHQWENKTQHSENYKLRWPCKTKLQTPDHELHKWCVDSSFQITVMRICKTKKN